MVWSGPDLTAEQDGYEACDDGNDVDADEGAQCLRGEIAVMGFSRRVRGAVTTETYRTDDCTANCEPLGAATVLSVRVLKCDDGNR